MAARGAVAATVIERGEAITDYVGVVHTEADLSSKSSADDVLDQVRAAAVVAVVARAIATTTTAKWHRYCGTAAIVGFPPTTTLHTP